MSEKFRVIKKFVDQMDYYDLLACGAPLDEFDGESKEISRKISVDYSVEEIADVIASVFNYSFDKNDSSDMFLSVAELIKKELQS